MAVRGIEVAALAAMTPDELRLAWRRATSAPPPLLSPSLLRLALAWELQAKASGGLSRASQQQLDQAGRGNTRTTVPQPGTRLVRSWAGTLHVVIIDERQVIRWDGREWNSLSEVARAITGTRWSGPAFFGLKKRIAA